jgi:hypothetical protein
MDQWEDEGFQSASNVTPDSQSEPSMTPDLDLWEAALTYETSKRRCWERVGWYVSLPLPLNVLPPPPHVNMALGVLWTRLTQ